MHIYRFVPYLCLLLAACASDKQIPINSGSGSNTGGSPALPTGGIVISPDAFVPIAPDMGIPDASIPDATVQAPDAMPKPEPVAVPDYVTDVAADVVPAEGSYAVLGGGDFSRIVYWRGGRLLTRTFTVKIEPDTGGSVPNLGGIDSNRIRMETGDVELVGYRPPNDSGEMDGRLSGIVPASGSNGQAGWVVISEGADTKVLAHSLDELEMEPIDTGLFGPVRTAGYSYGANIANHGLIVGRTGAESDSPVGYSILIEGLAPQVTIPTRGHPLPADVRVAGPNWVFAFTDGMCTTLKASQNGPSQEIGMWKCNTDGSSRLSGGGGIGDEPIGLYAATQAKDRLVLWDPRPGHKINPQDAIVPASMPAAGGMDGAGGEGNSGGMMGGMPIAGGMAAGAGGQAMMADASEATVQDGVVVLGASSVRVEWLNELPAGHAVSLRGDGGDQLYLLDRVGASKMKTIKPDHLLGVIRGTAQSFFAIRWDTTTGMPVAEAVEFERVADAPQGTQAVCVNQVRAPETCDGIDHDCDGNTQKPICCPVDAAPYNANNPKFDVGSPITGNWFLLGPITGSAGGASNDSAKELTGYFSFSDRVEYRTIKKNQSGTCYGCFGDIKTLLTATRQGTVSAAIAESVFQNDEISTCPQDCPSALPTPRDPPSPPVGGMGVMGGQMSVGGEMAAGGNVAGASGAGGSPGGRMAGAMASGAGGMDAMDDEADMPQVRPLILLHYEAIGSTLDTGEVDILDAPCSQPKSIHITKTAGDFTIHVLCLSAHFSLQVTLDNNEYQRADNFVEQAYARGPLHWVGHPVKRVEDGQVVTYVLTASGDDHELDVYRIGTEGFQNIAVPPGMAELATASPESRSLPIRIALSDDMYSARVVDDRWLEVYVKNRGWARAASRRFARKVYLSAWDPVAFSLAEYNDPDAPGFDPIFQELVIYHHSLKTSDIHWGRRMNEGVFREKLIEFQGLNIADFAPQSVAKPRHTFNDPPILWWARGREGSAPTARTTGLSCDDI